jgi:enoyl-CoA hydratase
MDRLTCYRLDGGVASIIMDDGKVNAMSPEMIAELNEALDRAKADRAVVLLTGREGVLSAGFHLPTLRAGGSEAIDMVRSGFELAARLLSFPTPVVIACNGHAVAMGVFLLLSGDYRIGVAGPYKLMANEVAIGLTIPRPAVEILRQRLTPAYFNRATILSEPCPPERAVDAGFLDQVVEAAQLQNAARGVAEALSALDMQAHAASKLRARRSVLDAIRAGIEADYAAFQA